MTSALPLIVDGIAAWLAIGLLALIPTGRGFFGRSLFVGGALVGLAIAAVALTAVGDVAQAMVLPLGLPDLPFHLRLDALSAFFLVLLGATAAGISVFSAGYFHASAVTSPRLLCLQYHVFLAAMALVLVADDASFSRCLRRGREG